MVLAEMTTMILRPSRIPAPACRHQRRRRRRRRTFTACAAAALVAMMIMFTTALSSAAAVATAAAAAAAAEEEEKAATRECQAGSEQDPNADASCANRSPKEEETSTYDESNEQDDAAAAARGPLWSSLTCPDQVGRAKNDNSDYFDYFDEVNEMHASQDIANYRDSSFGGRAQTYLEMKRMRHRFVVDFFAPNLESSGGTLYESACGDGFKLLMTMESLHDELGIDNIVAFGNDYVADSVAVANRLFDYAVQKYDWISQKGTLCRGDSTNLSYIPSNAFDLAYTGVIDVLIDPLKLRNDEADKEEGITHEDLVEASRELCDSDDPADQALALKEQTAQEDWHSLWVKELLRIVKPGKAIIIEDIDLPVCDEDSDWGGVAPDWWAEAIDKYGWDADPDSLQIIEEPWYNTRYNVVMKKKSTKASSTGEAAAKE